MNKNLLVMGICALLFLVIFNSLCIGDDDNKSEKSVDDELDRFIGIWFGEWDWGNNYTSNENWTFYPNRTIRIVDEFGEDWGTYGLDGDRLKIKIPTPTAEHPDAALTKWYEYKFSNGDKTLDLESTLNKTGKLIKQG
jgi:hypothetical protein